MTLGMTIFVIMLAPASIVVMVISFMVMNIIDHGHTLKDWRKSIYTGKDNSDCRWGADSWY